MGGDAKTTRFVLPGSLGEALAERAADIQCGTSRDSSEEVDDLVQEVFRRFVQYDKAELIDDPMGLLFEIGDGVEAERATSSRYAGAGEVALLAIKESPDGGTRPPAAGGDVAEVLLTLRPRPRKFSH